MRNKIKSKYDLLRQQIYIIIYGANTFWGKLFDLSLLVVILLSLILITLESMPRYDSLHHHFFVVAEWVITVFFTVEYILRILCNKRPLNYIFSFWGIVDLLALLPMYLSFFIPTSKVLIVFRSLRLLRLFAILDLMPVLGQQYHLKLALKASRNKILVFVYFIIVLSIVLGTLMYLVEGPEHGYKDIPTSIYWCIVTMTTVGYGDISPHTALGQAIASFIMIMGYGIIAVPTGIVTAEYANANKQNPELEEHRICPRCTTFIYNQDANYCHNCGEKLS
ncbi:ion transporter [Flavobacterium agricola]|uniref:Ion transporter n=1 Tax=Flavobacterium agricola TaxID=2870839 RepID=A0ABY6M044_9FLAO|nr:ion transporter [Flavobacterium agricola]UYW01859.1 ion transporter [Flavobacterium agricola]